MTPSAPTQTDLSSSPQRRDGHRNKTLALVGTCLGIALVTHLLLSGGHATNRRYHTCAICRLNRVDYTSTLTGRVRSTTIDSSCSEWYRENIEANHDHVWIRSSTIGLLNLYGQTIGVGDNDETPGRVIWRLSSDQQIRIYEHFDDPFNAKRLFSSLADPEALSNRADVSILHSLRQWADSDFQGTWQAPVDLPP